MAFSSLRQALRPGLLRQAVQVRQYSIPRVADKIVTVTAVDYDGQRHPIKALVGQTLIQAFQAAGLEPEEKHRSGTALGSCNGNCEVTISNQWLEKLPPRSEDEEAALRYVGGNVGPNSRLGCQIKLTKELDGLVVSKVEDRPWELL